jgi:hypothetical protein
MVTNLRYLRNKIMLPQLKRRHWMGKTDRTFLSCTTRTGNKLTETLQNFKCYFKTCVRMEVISEPHHSVQVLILEF